MSSTGIIQGIILSDRLKESVESVGEAVHCWPVGGAISRVVIRKLWCVLAEELDGCRRSRRRKAKLDCIQRLGCGLVMVQAPPTLALEYMTRTMPLLFRPSHLALEIGR